MRVRKGSVRRHGGRPGAYASGSENAYRLELEMHWTRQDTASTFLVGCWR